MGTLGSTETSAPSGSMGATLGQHPMDRSTPAVSKATHPPLQTEAKGQTSIHQAFSTSSVPYNIQAVGEILNSSSPTQKKPRTREISWFCRSSSTMCRDHHGQGSTHSPMNDNVCYMCPFVKQNDTEEEPEGHWLTRPEHQLQERRGQRSTPNDTELGPRRWGYLQDSQLDFPLLVHSDFLYQVHAKGQETHQCFQNLLSFRSNLTSSTKQFKENRTCLEGELIYMYKEIKDIKEYNHQGNV